MKRFLTLLTVLAVSVFVCGCGKTAAYPDPTELFYVNDFADLLTDEQEQDFLTKAVSLEKATTAQVVIVTVNNLGGEQPYAYATELGRKWGVGNSETDNGVVILLSKAEREIFIAVGYGLEGALPDSKTGRIIDTYGLKLLQSNLYGEGLTAIGNALINEVYIEYGLEPETGYVNIESIPESASEGEKVLVSWAVMLIIVFIISVFSRRRGSFLFLGLPRIHTGGGGGFGGFGGFKGGGGSFGGGGAGRGF